MRGNHYAEDRWLFIDRVQDWFLRKNQFWQLLSIISFGAVICLQIFLVLASQASPGARQQSEFLVVPVLTVFVLSSFWRSLVHTFLSFSGSALTYGGMFLFHTKGGAAPLATDYVANRLGYGIRHASTIPPDSVADRYFIVGLFMLAFCIAIMIRPGFFKAKNQDGLPFPVWKGRGSCRTDPKSSSVELVPVSALLTYEESHLVAKYKFIVLAVSGTKFLVTPYDWVPQDSSVVRDEESNSIIGIL